MLKEGQATPVTITPSLPYVLNSPEFKKKEKRKGEHSALKHTMLKSTAISTCKQSKQAYKSHCRIVECSNVLHCH